MAAVFFSFGDVSKVCYFFTIYCINCTLSNILVKNRSCYDKNSKNRKQRRKSKNCRRGFDGFT
ncbi:hypothetical protein HH007_11920 [Treponema denticola]|nr:hypothetical protein E4N91_00200 [Treponema denticola]HCY95365.1 hypothetical protein [Treponema sp.]